MFERSITPHVEKALAKYKAITLIGPRQAGKTTLAKAVGSDFEYYNLFKA
jgi:predicted AAA+ superfamily ATPase